MDIYEAVPEKTIYAVVDHSQDFIDCLCVKTDFDGFCSTSYGSYACPRKIRSLAVSETPGSWVRHLR